MVADRLILCHSCEHRQKECHGPCPCTIDGMDIIHHAKAGQCPIGKFTGAPIDPAVLSAIAKQSLGCKGCGDPGGLGGL